MTTGFYTYSTQKRLLYNGSLYEKNSAALWLSEHGYTGTLQQAAKSVNFGTRGAAKRALRFQNKAV